MGSRGASRRATGAALGVAGTLWAGLAVLVGLWSMTEWASRWESMREVFVVGGVMFVAMGEFLFASLVADRLFPRAAAWIGLSVQGVSGGVFVAGLAALLVLMV